jgi:N-acetylneuraminate synthase
MIYTIAEIGINHNGSLNQAKKLIRMASLCGCDAVKFQKREIDIVYTQEFLDSHRESPWGTTQREQKEGIELTKNSYIELVEFCKEIDIDFGASAWDIESQYFLNSIHPQFHKVASPMLTNIELLESIAIDNKHTFISTGMSSAHEISKAIEIFNSYGCSYELMHCVSVYPMPVDIANIKRIKTLRDMFRCNVGYSGHEVGVSVSIAACAMGISSLERHITLDRSDYGSDQPASIEIEGLRKLVKYSKEVESAMGEGNINASLEEKEVKIKLRTV